MADEKIEGTVQVDNLAQKVVVGGDAATLLMQAASTERSVSLKRTATTPTPDLPLWVIIRKSTEAMQFRNYLAFMDYVLCGDPNALKEVDEIEKEVMVGGKEDRQYEGDKPQETKTSGYGTLKGKRYLPFNDTDAYRLLKVATEAFLVVNCGVWFRNATAIFDSANLAKLNKGLSLDPALVPGTGDGSLYDFWWKQYLQNVNGVQGILPYFALIKKKLPDVDIVGPSMAGEPEFPADCFGILQHKLTNPCLCELIWSYWHEEGMLVQTMNAISLRFQNVRGAGERDPLAMVEISPLRPLNNLIWGYIQDEHHRLSVLRRVYEYDHHYGLTLQGKAVPPIRTADSRSKFLEAFHNLLYLCWLFFKEDDDTTVIADGFPVLNALKEVHLLLTEGAHNQFGDLPCTARQEMLIQQWLLARPEFREFLPTRIMVAYPEPWMDRVDAMKRLQGWTDVSVREFHDLGVHGERILLSIRFGAWLTVDDPVQAANWARFWRPEVQGYIHSYRSVAGVDMTTEVTDARQAALRSAQPSTLLRERLVAQHRQLLALQPGVSIPSVPVRSRPVVGRRN
jgi:hypothetical protein